jgi:hypothetical protein
MPAHSAICRDLLKVDLSKSLLPVSASWTWHPPLLLMDICALAGEGTAPTRPAEAAALGPEPARQQGKLSAHE